MQSQWPWCSGRPLAKAGAEMCARYLFLLGQKAWLEGCFCTCFTQVSPHVLPVGQESFPPRTCSVTIHHRFWHCCHDSTSEWFSSRHGQIPMCRGKGLQRAFSPMHRSKPRPWRTPRAACAATTSLTGSVSAQVKMYPRRSAGRAGMASCRPPQLNVAAVVGSRLVLVARIFFSLCVLAWGGLAKPCGRYGYRILAI